jgi:DNA replication protein DnaC
MNIDETIRQLGEMKLPTMAKALRELLETSPGHQLSFEEKIALIVDREWTDRDNRRLERRIREAKLGQRANVDDIVCDPSRGFEKSVLRELRTNQWARSQHNIILVGPTGIGKSFLASALAENACRHGFRAMFCRVPRLMDELALAKVAGHYAKTLDKLSRVDVLVLDDFLLAPMKESERRDLLEILVDRYDRSSTIFTSQVPTKEWHEALGDPTVADAICDRIVHNAHIFVLRGPSMRRKKSLQNKEVPTP